MVVMVAFASPVLGTALKIAAGLDCCVRVNSAERNENGRTDGKC